MRILITNDDGIYSHGLEALATVAARFGEVRVVAPHVEQSAMGHAITIQRPLKYHPTRLADFEAYRVNGSDPDFAAVLSHVEDVIRLLLEFKRPFLVNVNLPQHPIGLCWTRQSVREYNGRVVEGADPMGRRHYWFAAKPLTDPDENTDRWAVDNNFVALTPLRLNLTDEAWLQQMLENEAARMAA